MGRRRRIAGAVAAILLLGLGTGGPPPAAAQGMQIGVVLPLSVPSVRDVSREALAGAQQAVDEQNRRGKLRPVGIVPQDDKGDAKLAALTARELIEKGGVVALLAGLSAAESIEIGEQLAATKTPGISLALIPSKLWAEAQEKRRLPPGQFLLRLDLMSEELAGRVRQYFKDQKLQRGALYSPHPALDGILDDVLARLDPFKPEIAIRRPLPDLGKDEILDFGVLSREKIQFVLGVTSQSRQRAQLDAVSLGFRRGEQLQRPAPAGAGQIPVVLFTPPSARLSAYLATRAIIQAAELAEPTRPGIAKALRNEVLYNPKTGAIRVDWGLAAFGLPQSVIKDVRRATGGTTPCTCCGRSGRSCRLEFCRQGEQCDPETRDDDCEPRCRDLEAPRR